MIYVGAADVERFRGVLADHLGLAFDDTKLAYLTEVLARRLEATQTLASLYLTGLERERGRDELRALVQELTVPETYFFRNWDQFRALIEVVLPERLAARPPPDTLRILSAGCASGEEAYSLAIVVREHAGPTANVSIHAVDVNPAMLKKAARARYSAWSLRETSPEARRRWFRPDGKDVSLDPEVRTAVTFAERNLIHDHPDLWQPDYYDVVFCRNVIMYLAPAAAGRVVAHITRSLSPGGYLFLGHAENLRGVSKDFHLCHTHGTFYYRRKDTAASTLTFVAANEAIPALDATWIQTIQRASERIHVLAHPPQASGPALVGPSRVGVEIGFAIQLLREERFAEALDLVGRLPAVSARDPAVLLLRAVLLTHSGRLADAERAGNEILAVDELNAGAHHLLALCREGAGDRQGAVDHDQIAVHLDPAFAMPRLHLGLMARRAGDDETVRRELGQALLLLAREDTSRLLLFGGGFGRDALLALCRAELVASGGRP
jgi:chemotaxis protein methyltransferase CheR